MHKTGIEDHYIIKDNKKMRFGYTTGTCAAAAAKAAAQMLLSGERIDFVKIRTPYGIELELELLETERSDNSVSCCIRKDGGDDPDATHGYLIGAKVERKQDAKLAADAAKVHVDGGVGVGRVTKAGMKQKIGEAAINPVPMQMITENVDEVRRQYKCEDLLEVTIFVPEGEKIAKKTFNPRLGIVGGISILGTTGIVEPMSKASLVASIQLEMNMKYKTGQEQMIITPGNYGNVFVKSGALTGDGAFSFLKGHDFGQTVQCSNYVGETLDMAVNMGIKGILFVSHVGKFIKVAGGIMNTHSHEADCRAELMAAFALRAGADAETANRILNTITTDEALDIMEEKGIRQKAMELAAEKIRFYMQFHTGGRIKTEAVIFSDKYGFLAATKGAAQMAAEIAAGMAAGEDGAEPETKMNGETPEQEEK